MKFFLSLLISAALVFGVVHFGGFLKSDEELIRDQIQAFEEAYNDGDTQAILECFEPRIKNAYSAMYSIVGGVSFGGLSLEASLSDLFSIGNASAMKDGPHIEINEIEINGDHATVRVTLRSGSFSESGGFKMVKENQDWYIRDGGSNIK